MNSVDPGRKTATKWFWLLAIVLLFLLLLLWLVDPMGDPQEADVAADEPMPAITATMPPENPGVPVTLPETPIEGEFASPVTGEPAASGTPAPEAPAE